LFSAVQDAVGVVIFEASPETVVIRLNTQSILAIFENIGSLAGVLLFLAKFLVGSLEKRMLESELIEKFYQVEKSWQEGDYKEDEVRADPAPVMRDDDFNTSKQALKNRKRAVKPTDLSETVAHSQLKISW